MTAPGRNAGSLLRFAPAVLLVTLFVVGLSTGVADQLSLTQLRAHHHQLHLYAIAHPAAAAGLYALVFVIAVASSLPVALLLTVAGGAIFGPWVGAGLTIVSATLGAVITYAAARLAGGSTLQQRIEQASGVVRWIIDHFGRNTFSHILTMRLIPLFPFSPVNVAAGLARVPLTPFVAATLLGEIPTATIYANFGAGLSRVLGNGTRPDLRILGDPQILLPMVGLALLSLVPTAIRWWRARRARI
ncbi:MAG TPA: VTT domain-containing protein [Phenylobacterium sp.]|nr:VTT domain-containing protein [Phenylobacterium sp.]